MEIIHINTLPTCGLCGCPIHSASHIIYTFTISPDEVFNRTCNRSMVFVKRNNIEDPNMVIGKDSEDFFNDLFDVALSDLLILFARWQKVSQIESSNDHKIYDIDGNEVEYNAWIKDVQTGDYQVSLILSKVNDTTVLQGLNTFATDFIIKRILEQFYGADFLSEQAKQRLVDILNYRTDKIKIKTSPL